MVLIGSGMVVVQEIVVELGNLQLAEPSPPPRINQAALYGAEPVKNHPVFIGPR